MDGPYHGCSLRGCCIMTCIVEWHYDTQNIWKLSSLKSCVMNSTPTTITVTWWQFDKNCSILDEISFKLNVYQCNDLIESISLKIISCILFLVCETFFNMIAFLSVMFERYGSDWMKRSINNQLFSQLAVAMMLNNNLVTPCFMWR